MAAPPIIKIPPPSSSGKKNAFDQFVAAHKGLSQYKTAIQQWAGEYGVPALWVAAAIWKESKGQNAPWNPAVQGAGVAQINLNNPPAAAQLVLGRPLTKADAMNPNTAIQILAYSMTGAASLDQWYQSTWNPGFRPDPQNVLPSTYLKGYTVSVTGHTPQQKVAGETATKQAQTQNLAYLELQARQTVDPLYLAYTGKRATTQQLADYVRNPVSTYQMQQALSNPKINPNIYNSPVWKTYEGKYTAWYQQVFGPNAVVPKSVILDGIVHNKEDQAGFEADLRAGKVPGQAAYNTSEQYLGGIADMTKVYSNIMGAPDAAGTALIQKAVMNGWNQSQMENYLRQQPGYTNSPEYQQRAIMLAQSMGMIPRIAGQGDIGQTALAGGQTQAPPSQTQLPSMPTGG